MPIIHYIGVVFSFMGPPSLDRYHFYFLKILKETLTFMSLSNPAPQYLMHITATWQRQTNRQMGHTGGAWLHQNFPRWVGVAVTLRLRHPHDGGRSLTKYRLHLLVAVSGGSSLRRRHHAGEHRPGHQSWLVSGIGAVRYRGQQLQRRFPHCLPRRNGRLLL